MDTHTFLEIQLKIVALATKFIQQDKLHQIVQFNTVKHVPSKTHVIVVNQVVMFHIIKQQECKHVNYVHNQTVHNATIIWAHASGAPTVMH